MFGVRDFFVWFCLRFILQNNLKRHSQVTLFAIGLQRPANLLAPGCDTDDFQPAQLQLFEVRDTKETIANIHSSGRLLSPAVTGVSLTTKLIHTETTLIFTEHPALTTYYAMYFLHSPYAFLTFGHISTLYIFFPPQLISNLCLTKCYHREYYLPIKKCTKQY